MRCLPMPVMNCIMIAFCIIFVSGRAHADPQLGGKVGPNMARWVRVSDEASAVARIHKPGFVVGGYLNMRRWKPFIPQAEFSFTTRGTDYDFNGENVGRVMLNYIDLALLARVEVPVKSICLYGLVGPELNVLLTAGVTEMDGSVSDIKENMKPIDIGVLAGVGVAVGPFSWGTLTIEGRYDMGFINVDKDDNEDGATFFNRTFSIMLGYEYRRDRDKDGIIDANDRCPKQPEDKDGFQDSDGCPDPDDE